MATSGTPAHTAPPGAHRLDAALRGDDQRQFWLLQAAGWLGLCVVTFFSLTLWYNTLDLVYIVHTLLQAVLGIAVSLPMREAFRRLWSKPVPTRLALSALVVVVASAAWTALRLQTFIWIVHERDVWADFGGWYFGSFMVLSSWTLAYHALKYHQLMLREKERALRAQADVAAERVKRLTAEGLSREAQLKMLRYQLNPHFLFNTLNSISALIKREHNAEAREMVTGLARFLRHALDSDPALKTTVEQEIETLALYLDIERKRFGPRLSVDYAVEPEAETALMPAFLLQPLVENSLKFAVGRSAEPVTITLSARRHEGWLELGVADTGAGLGRAPGLDAPTGPGVGLKNVRQRLETEFGDDHRFEMSPADPSGLAIAIRLPFEDADRAGQAAPRTRA